MSGFFRASVIAAILVALTTTLDARPQNSLAMQMSSQSLHKPLNKPNFSMHGAGSGNGARNWHMGVGAGAGMKVWQSRNGRHGLGVGADYGRSFGRSGGRSWSSRPSYGAGVSYGFKF